MRWRGEPTEPASGPPSTGVTLRLVAAVAGTAVLGVVVIGGILALRGAPDHQTEYDGDVARGFMAVCTADADDLGFTDPEGFCRCTYDRIRTEIPFERFVELDEALQGPPGSIPDAIDTIRRVCFAGTATPVPTTSPRGTTAAPVPTTSPPGSPASTAAPPDS